MATLSVLPSGALHVVYHVDSQYSAAIITQSEIIHGFTHSTEEGLFALLTTNIKDNGSSVLKYWQDFTQLYVDRLTHQINNEEKETLQPPSDAILGQFALQIPPMPGSEYVTIDALKSIWISFDTCLC